MSPGSLHLKCVFVAHGKLKISQLHVIVFVALRNYFACIGILPHLDYVFTGINAGGVVID